MTWTVIINAAPERIEDGLFQQTFQSIRAAGWTDADWHIEVSEWTLDNAWEKWCFSLRQALRYSSDQFLICQDDILLSPNIRDTLELNRGAVHSLYSPMRFPYKSHGWHATPKGAWGACALACDRLAVPALSRHHWHYQQTERAIDAQLLVACKQLMIPHFTHVPSLVQHVGADSILHPGSPLDEFRTAEWSRDAINN